MDSREYEAERYRWPVHTVESGQPHRYPADGRRIARIGLLVKAVPECTSSGVEWSQSIRLTIGIGASCRKYPVPNVKRETPPGALLLFFLVFLISF